MNTNELTMAHECGRVVLWVGNEAKEWTPAQFASEAEFARSLGIDSICVKVSDGGLKWYGDAAHLAEIRAAVLAKGCGFIPFIYCYGPKLGTQQIHDECTILAEMMSVCPVVQADMEAEWNGQVAAATLFESLMRPVSGLLSVSTWADPNQQNWQGVIRALAPCVNAWTPQQYTDWLAAQEVGGQLADMGLTIQPGIDLAPEFGSDHVLSIASQAVARGHYTVYLWETATARNNPALVREVVAEMAKLPALPPLPTNTTNTTATVASVTEPTPAPAPAPTAEPTLAPTPTPTPEPNEPDEPDESDAANTQQTHIIEVRGPIIID